MQQKLSDTHPKYVFHPNGSIVKAQTPEHEARLREQGYTLDKQTPVIVEPPKSPEEQLAEAVAEKNAMEAKFNDAWDRLQGAHQHAISRIAELEADAAKGHEIVKSLTDANAALVRQMDSLSAELAATKAAPETEPAEAKPAKAPKQTKP